MARRLNSEEQRIFNEGLAAGASAYSKGELNDPELNQILEGLEKYRELEQMGGDYMYVSPAKRKSDREAGKVFLVEEPRVHDVQQHPLTHKAIAATQLMHEKGGTPLVAPPAKELAVKRAKELIEDIVMPTSVANLGSGGERSELPRTNEERLDVMASRLVDRDRGYNSKAGYAYGGMPLDAGHDIGYINRPDLANKGSNITEENAYANRSQAATEKMAGNQGREATNAELADGIFKSHLNKILEDVQLPGRKGSKERQAYMEPINQKLMNNSTDAVRTGPNQGPQSGDNEKLVINNTGGGTVVIQHGIEDVIANGKGKKRRMAGERLKGVA